MYSTYTSRTVASAIKKFDHLDKTPPSKTPVKQNNSKVDQKPEIKLERLTEPKSRSRSRSPCPNVVKTNTISTVKSPLDRSRLRTVSPCPLPKRSDKISLENKRDSPKNNDVKSTLNVPERLGNNNLTSPQSLRYRSPSPSLLRKTQSSMAKEQNNERVVSKLAGTNGTKTPSKLSPSVPRIDKPQSEKFQRVSAFWNSPKT